VRCSNVLSVQPIDLGSPNLVSEHNPLLDQTLRRFADTLLGAVAQQPVDSPPTEAFFRTSENRQNIAIQSWRYGAKWVAEVHVNPHYSTYIRIIVRI
jgi:hypothetical protein